jgi:3-hydroxyisobutyrate dehydrogenase
VALRSVAVLGTGIMGAPMARNLAKAGLEVRAWNRTREKAEPLASDGIAVADSPAEAVGGADALVTMLADGDAVKEVAHDALADAGDTLWLQTSTVGLAATRELAELADGTGTPFVDSPVLGTKQPAEQGELTVLASGPEKAREQAAPVFDAIGKQTIWLGEAGGGTRMKLVLNGWLLALTAALGESIALAQQLGADPATFLEILDGAPMGSPYAQLKGKAILGDKLDDPSFPLELAAKDARLVLEAAAQEAGAEPKLARAATALFEAAVEQGHGEADMAAVYRAAATAGQ